MDPYTIGILLKQLLASAGLKATLAIIICGGSVAGVVKALRFFGGFLERMQASRDALMSETMQRMAQQDAQRVGYQVELAKVLERINGNAAVALEEARDTRKEMHQRFNQASLEHTEMKERLSEIKGAMG